MRQLQEVVYFAQLKYLVKTILRYMFYNKLFSSITLFSLIMLSAPTLIAQGQLTSELDIELNWSADPQSFTGPDGPIHYLHFQGANYDEAEMLPLWIQKINLPNYSIIDLQLVDPVYSVINNKDGANWQDNNSISAQARLKATASYRKGRPVANIEIMPIRKNSLTAQYERLESARIKVFIRPDQEHQQLLQSFNSRSSLTTSALASGNIYKIALSETGVYKMDYNFLSELGVDVDNIDPRNIQLLGNGGRMIPQTIGDPATVDDLEENAIFVSGQADGNFDSGDYLLFFAEGPKYWLYNDDQDYYYQKHNTYTEETYFFLKIGSTAGKRVSDRASLSSASYNTNSYDARYHYEDEAISLMNEFFSLPPSGRLWVSDPFQVTRNRSYTIDIPNRIVTAPIRLRAEMFSRFFSGSGSFDAVVNGQTIASANFTSVSSYIYSRYAQGKTITANTTTSSPTIELNLNFNQSSTAAEAWLDYFSITTRASLIYNGNQFTFSDRNSIGANGAAYQLSNASGTTIWDVTDPYNVQKQLYNGSTNINFNAPTDTLREFVIFNVASTLTPIAVGAIPNQNLHSITTAPNLLIFYHKDFSAAANRLASHRVSHSGMTTLAVDVEEVYNEFGSGMPDITALRNFAEMLYSRSSGNDSLRYILLFGGGTYDYKGINNTAAVNPNFVPVYESSESLDPLRTYTSDDYFVLLDPGEGNLNSNQDLDAAVGRLPVKTTTEADEIVDKIIRYDTDPRTLGDWRNRLLFVADDEDNNLHIRDGDQIAANVANAEDIYNQNKIYLDAYVQQSTAGGSRYPDVNADIMRSLFKGTLIVNYLGHGGGDGWAQERVFTNTEISQLQNDTKMPLFITATCSFAPFDDPSYYSAGELLILNPNGGASSLLTTVRVVLADANRVLTEETFNHMFQPVGNRMPTIGEVLQRAKNASGNLSASNSRKYVLLGDPSMTLAYPEQNVVTTKINNQPVGTTTTDTIQALQYVTIEGEVRDWSGNLLQNFNGIVNPTVFDKVDTIATRANDPSSSPRDFLLQKKIIFNGSATVTNGKFSFSFVVPLDINYQLGYGKISYYANDGNSIDAHGAYHDLVIGGTYPGASEDNEGPEVMVYMNTEDFASGGLTDNDPTLLVKLEDDNGINTVGNGIGHDLTSILRYTVEDQENSYILNDFYEADVDNFRKGTVQYPLSSLPEGLHNIKVKAWDVYNNMGEGETDFVVASNAEMALDHVLNYPNPFTTNTEFMFEHNLPYQDLDVLVQIYTVSGKLVKSIQQNIPALENDGYRIRGIQWDGLDEFGDNIGRGVYVYKVTVRAAGLPVADDETPNIQQESEYQKLVILR